MTRQWWALWKVCAIVALVINASLAAFFTVWGSWVNRMFVPVNVVATGISVWSLFWYRDRKTRAKLLIEEVPRG